MYILCEKLFERLPLGSSVVRNSRIFDSKIMVENSDETNERCMKNSLNVVIKLKIITPAFGDKSLRQFCEYLISKDLKENMERVKEFDRKIQRSDNFYFKQFVGKYPNFAFIMKLILTLSHGSASAERGFSVCNSLTMTAQHFVIDHMQSNNLKPVSIELPSKMLHAVECAYRKHAEAKEAKIRRLSYQLNKINIIYLKMI